MNPRRRLLIRLWALSLASALVPGGGALLEAQTTDPKIPASSPVWWTLTDEISPQELRRVYGDEEASRERYRRAVAAGLAEAVPAEKLESLVFFQNGAQSPELLPMYEALDAFALRFRHRPQWAEQAPLELESHGISAAGIDIVTQYAHRLLADIDALIEEVKHGQQGFLEVMDKAEASLGEKGLRRAVEARDVESLSVASGVPVPEIRRRMTDWETDPLIVVSERMLPQLKRDLTARDWERLRTYLLEEVSPVSSAVEFED